MEPIRHPIISVLRGSLDHVRGLGSATCFGLLLIGLLMGCGKSGSSGGTTVPAPPVLASITVFPSAAQISVGATQQYTIALKDSNGNTLTDLPVTWSTSHPELATIDQAGLAMGVASGTTTLTATREGITSQFVTLTVTGAPVQPAIGTSPTNLSFTAQTGANPATQTLTISNTGGGTLTWTVSDTATWLTLGPAMGSGDGVVTASVNTGTLTTGTYSDSITVSASGAVPVTIPVILTITAAVVPPAIGVSPTSLSFTAPQGGGNPAAQTLNISNTGGGTLVWSISSNANWALLSPTSGTGNGTVTISVTPSALPAGSYSGVITVSGAGATSVTIPVTLTVTGTTARSPLPPWLTYCDNALCAGLAPVVAAVCPNASPSCAPSRSTTVIPQVNGVEVSAVFLPLVQDLTLNGQGLFNATVRLLSGDGFVYPGSSFVFAYTASSVQLRSELEFLVSFYGLPPVWGGTTALNFTTTHLSALLLDTIFYQHPSYTPPDTSAAALHAQGQSIIETERAITGITTSEHVTVHFLPTELAVAQSFGEGNFSYGNGTITVNYGHPLFITAIGGLAPQALARMSHEYAHELFDEIKGAFLDNFACLNEGVADALGFTSGFLPEPDFGPIGVRGLDFEEGCPSQTAIHDIGNCYFWHVKKAGLLRDSFMREIFHPQHQFVFNSCEMNENTGNSLLVYFTEAAKGANMIPVLNAMKLPHAASYIEAMQALGF